MRIIHEMTVPVQISMTPHPYNNIPGMCGYNGMRVELLMVNSPSANFRDDAKLFEPLDKEILEIEGSLEVVLDAFRQVVSTLENIKTFYQEAGGSKRAIDCPKCESHSESRDPNGYHTWECRAKWDEDAKKIIQEDPNMVHTQQKMIDNAREKLSNMHSECGGCGCSGCEWTGNVLTTT